EVLYGPQGTLFGKNSDGGAINIVTRTPELSRTGPDGTVELQTGNFGLFKAHALLDIPLVNNRAALQVSASESHQNGYSVRAGGQHQANQNRSAGRVNLVLRPSGKFHVSLRGDGTIFNEESGAYRLVAVRLDSTIPTLYAAAGLPYDNRWVTKSDFQYD